VDEPVRHESTVEPGLALPERVERAPLAGLVASRPSDGRAIVGAAFEAHQREVFSFTLHGTRDPEAAEDITQETFLRLLREVDAGRTPDNIRAWLYRVAANLVVTRGRKATVAGRWLRAIARQEETRESPERITLRREASDALEAALATMPHDASVALLLAAQGFTGREVAAAIGRSEAATRTMLCRARLQLRARLEAPGDDR
jgi:RNA polymerase sigma-70 factor (ECF subfamily)